MYPGPRRTIHQRTRVHAKSRWRGIFRNVSENRRGRFETIPDRVSPCQKNA